MSITRLQQARQMYAMGQRVGRAFGGVMGSDGRRQYGGGSDMGASGGYGYQGGSTNKAGKAGTGPGSAESSGGGKGNGGGGDPPVTSANIDDIVLTSKDYKKHARKFDVGVAGGYAKDSGTTIDPYQQFRSYRPEIQFPNFGIFGMAANLAKKPIQAFANFTTAKNRNYFMDEVVRAGKIPGLDYGTVSEMTNQELEAAYKGYLSDRLSGKTDAYGNPNPGYNSGGGGPDQGIATLYNNNMFDDTEENASDPFVSRYLQNQPDDIREEIESRMQDYYTV